jgi:hypothetical protein
MYSVCREKANHLLNYLSRSCVRSPEAGKSLPNDRTKNSSYHAKRPTTYFRPERKCMRKLLWRSLWLAVGAFTVMDFAGRANCQTNSPANTASKPMPEYIEDFFLSEAVRSEDKNELQSTLSAESFRRNGTDADLEFEYGLTNRLQLSTELPYGIQSSVQSEVPASWSIVSLGVQYQFLRSSHPFAFTAGLATDLPVTSRGEFALEPGLLAAKQFHFTQIHASFEADLANEERDYSYNLASVTNLHCAWFPTLEFNGRSTDLGSAFYFTPGIYRHLPHRVEAGLAVPMGSHPGIVGKLTWEVGGDKDE